MILLQSVARKVAGTLGRDSWPIRHMRPFYESLLDWSSGGSGISWTINEVTYRIDPRHRHRLGHDYDAHVAAFLSERVKEGDICFDVGANVGVYVLQFAHWSRPTGRVIAFEPNPVACNILRKHKALDIVVEMQPDIWESAYTTRPIVEATLANLGLHPLPLTGQRDPLNDYGLIYLAHE